MYKNAKPFRGSKPSPAKPTKLKMGGGGGRKKGLVQKAYGKAMAEFRAQEARKTAAAKVKE